MTVENNNEDTASQIYVGQVYFEGAEDVPIYFANHIFARVTPDGFLVSFAQSHGPYETDFTAERLAEEKIPARVISRLLIPHGRMRDMLNVLNGLFEKNVTILPAKTEDANDNDIIISE